MVLIIFYGLKGYFNIYVMLDIGSICSLLLVDVVEKFGLDGLLESVFLNGI